MPGLINRRPWWLRWPFKITVFAIGCILVLFPRVDRLPATLQRHSNPNILIEPDSRVLDPLVAEFDADADPEWTPEERLRKIEAFVYEKIEYEWDWNLWGNADYFPTLEEAVGLGKEDCDGRAVVAASMLQRYGYEATLVSDFKHVWVATDRGEAMGPGDAQAVTFTEGGPQIDWTVLWTLPKAFAMGIAVFPLYRELMIAGLLWVLLYGPRSHVRRHIECGVLIAAGLLVMHYSGYGSFRYYGEDQYRQHIIELQWLGVGLWGCALYTYLFSAPHRTTAPAQSPSVEGRD